MIINKIRMHNFFRYYQDQTIEFVHDTHKNVTVVIGENGWGKTTILGAFLYGFYGIFEKPLLKDEMLNERAFYEMREGETGNSFVEIGFEDGGTCYTVRREQLFKRIGSTSSPIGEEKLSIKYLDHIGNSKDVLDNKGFFNKIIPIDLKQFFFFDGEKINRLAQEEGKEEIKEAILNLLGLNVIENLKSDLEKADQKLNRKMKKYLRGEGAKLRDIFADKIEMKRELEKQIKYKIKEKKEQEDALSEISTFLLKHNIETIRLKEEERKNIESDILSIKKEIKQGAIQINGLISKKSKHYLIKAYTQKIKEILEEKRKKGELPSDIKATFVNDLIQRGTCICGNEILENSMEYKNLVELKKTAGKRELDDAYIRIITYIEQIENEDFFDEYNRRISLEIDKVNEKKRKENRKKEIDKDLKNIAIEEINLKTEARRVIEKRIADVRTDIKSLERNHVEIEKEIKDLNTKINKYEIRNEEAKKIQEFIDRIRDLADLNNDINKTFKDDVRKELDHRIKEVFRDISHKDYREPVLTKDLTLKVINNFYDEKKGKILSTGESQVASLSFIGALVSYCRDKKETPIYSNFMGGDFPIVMDSPFGNLDSEHSAHIARGIGSLSNQVIIIVSEKQWANEVEINIHDRLGRMYYLNEGDICNEQKGEYTYIKEATI